MEGHHLSGDLHELALIRELEARNGLIHRATSAMARLERLLTLVSGLILALVLVLIAPVALEITGTGPGVPHAPATWEIAGRVGSQAETTTATATSSIRPDGHALAPAMTASTATANARRGPMRWLLLLLLGLRRGAGSPGAVFGGGVGARELETRGSALLLSEFCSLLRVCKR